MRASLHTMSRVFALWISAVTAVVATRDAP
jgi:hypothetical protein